MPVGSAGRLNCYASSPEIELTLAFSDKYNYNVEITMLRKGGFFYGKRTDR